MSCKCDMRTKLVGDGCKHCNPHLYIDILEETIRAHQAEINEQARLLGISGEREMTDARKEFEEWARLFMDKNERAPFSNEIWQACQSLNDKRIADLMAVIAKKDEALLKSCQLIEKFSLQVYNGSDCLRIYNAVELQPADVELVEVGYVTHFDMEKYHASKLIGTATGDKLYTIKQKGQNNAANS